MNPTEVRGWNARWGRRNRETRSCHLMVRKRVKRQKPRREGWGGGDNQKLQGKIAPPAICPLCAPPARVWFQLARAYGQLPAFYYRRRVHGVGEVRVPRGGLGLALPGSIFLARVLPLFSVLDLRGGGVEGGRGTTPPASCLARERYVAPPSSSLSLPRQQQMASCLVSELYVGHPIPSISVIRGVHPLKGYLRYSH